MHFDYNTITLLSQGGSVGQWTFEDVAYWNFEDLPDGLEKTDSEQAQVVIEDGKIRIAGEAKEVALYDVTGRLVSKQFSIDLNALPAGTYVLKVGDKSIKFMVR